MLRPRQVLLLVALAPLMGCSAGPMPTQVGHSLEFLEAADQVELLSLDPVSAEDGFHGWKVLGRTTSLDADAGRRVVSAVAKSVREYGPGEPAMCFEPRHGIRATRGGSTVDYVICFECCQIRVYTGGEQGKYLTTTGSAEPVLDAVLREAGVPLAAKADK